MPPPFFFLLIARCSDFMVEANIYDRSWTVNDIEYSVTRYISEFCDSTEELIAQYPISSFDLPGFQRVFGETNPDNPMFDCYPVTADHLEFLSAYMDKMPQWDFTHRCYFLECHAP